MAIDHGAIVEALRTGESQNAVARRLGCGLATVNRVAKRNGLECHTVVKGKAPPQTVIAISGAAEDYALERRLLLLNKIFSKAEQMVETVRTPHQLQALAISIGILTDKRRLEDGEVTSRTELYGDDIRERLASRLDELAARRRPAGSAG
jgi:hypothetical protein